MQCVHVSRNISFSETEIDLESVPNVQCVHVSLNISLLNRILHSVIVTRL